MGALKRVTLLGAMLLSGAALAAGGEEGTGGAGYEKGKERAAGMKQGKDIIATAKEAGNFKTFLKAVDQAGLTEKLKEEGPYTVFAPTDEAFAKLGKRQLDALMKDKEQLRSLLLSHVVEGQQLTSAQVRQLEEGEQVRTAGDTNLTFKQEGQKLFVEDAAITRPNLRASNGVIHVIDSVIQPEQMQEPMHERMPGQMHERMPEEMQQ